MIFEANVEHIRILDSLQLVQLMKRLMLAECRLTNTPLRSTNVPLQITIPDGGEDGKVEWSDGSPTTDFFPSRHSIFQAKAQNLTETSVKKEIISKSKKKPSKLNDAISEVLAERGAYIIFCSEPFTGAKIGKLKKAIKDTIIEYEQDASSIVIEVYDANKIATWVDSHHSVALWLASFQRGRSLHGFLSHEGWGKSSDIINVPWVIGKDENRFTTQSRLFVPEERKDKPASTYWDFSGAREACLKYLSDDRAILRIYGPSGFGKSRFAYELFNATESDSDEIDNANVIYADCGVVDAELFKLAQEIAEAGVAVILIADECSDQDHSKLAKIISRAGSRARIITINTETAIKGADGTLAIGIEPASDEMIKDIAKITSPEISDSDARIIQEIAKGFPKMAVLAAQSDGASNAAIGSAAEYIERIVWGERQKNDAAQKAIEILSLFEWVGTGGEAECDAAYIAEHFVNMNKDIFIEHINSFVPRGIVYKRGNYAQVIPVPLAANLGAYRLSLLPDNKFFTFFNDAPKRLQHSLLKRIRWLDIAPESITFVDKIFAPECIGNYTELNTDFGAECLDRLVHLAPDAVMAVIQNVFGSLSIDELRGVQAGRRHLVWVLEKLVFRNESFEQAARLLRRLAAAETEGGIANNASGQFKQLFQLQLSGTEAEPCKRIAVLDEGLASTNENERELCIEALNTMLDMGHFSRSGGAEEIGSGKRLVDWRPKTWGEVHDYCRNAISRLLKIATSNDQFADKARNHLGYHIRGLLGRLPLDEVKEIVSTVSSHYGFWYSGIKGVNQWLYYDRKDVSEDIGSAIREYFDELMPSDPVEQLIIYTRGWHADFHNPDVTYNREEESGKHDFYYASRKAEELAPAIISDQKSIDIALDALVSADANNVAPFSKRLAELSSDPIVIFREAVNRVDKINFGVNLHFFNGFIAGTDSLNPDIARECIKMALQSKLLKAHAIQMIGSGKLQAKDISLVVSLLKSGDVQPWQCVMLSYGRGMDHLEPETIMPLIKQLEAHGAVGLWTALRVIYMILHGKNTIAAPFVKPLISILLAPELFNPLRNNMDGHNFAQAIKLLARNGHITKQVAHSLVQQILSICNHREDRVFYELDSYAREGLTVLMEIHPKEVWDGISSMLLNEDALLVHMLENLLKFDHDNHLDKGLLYSLPAEIYLDWVRQNPEERAHVVVNWLPIATKNEGGTLSWHKAMEGFVSDFGDNDKVLSAIAGRFYPTLWGGSLVPHLELLLTLLEQWFSHSKVGVRAWANDQKCRVEKKIKAEKFRDEEQEVRYS